MFDVSPSGSRGFTLIEVIGVLAVVAILASVLASVVIKRVDIAARSRDAAELSAMADALQTVILTKGQIPNTDRVFTMLADQMQASTNQLMANSRGINRVFIVDPGFTNTLMLNGYLYDQTDPTAYNGTQMVDTTQPSAAFEVPGFNLRVMIISSLMSTNATPIPASFNFTEAWNTPDGSVPATWLGAYPGWNNHGDDLRIQRIDLTHLFCHVILTPIDTNRYGSYAVAIGTGVSHTNQLSAASFERTTWYLQGTGFRLFDANTNLEKQLFVQSDASFVFEDSHWRNLLTGGGAYGPVSECVDDNFMSWMTTFATFPINQNAPPGDSVLAVLGTFSTYMQDYTLWAATGFSNGTNISLDAANLQTVTFGAAK